MKRYIWAFPGLGKSSLMIPGLSVDDADSERFKFAGVDSDSLHGSREGVSFARDETYPLNYLSYIQSSEADVVLLNCHVSLLEQLDKDDLFLVYPDISLIPEYLQRYKDRGDHPSFVSYMEDEASGIIRYIEGSDLQKYRVKEPNIYLRDLFERNDFKVKVMTRAELGDYLQRAMDLGVIRDELHTDGPSKLVCNVQFAHEPNEHPLKHGHAWAEAVLDGRYELDIEQLQYACLQREAELRKEREQLIVYFQRAIDLNILDTDKAHQAIVCDLSFAAPGTSSADYHDAYDLAEAVMNGKYVVDIDDLLEVCKQRELQLEEMRCTDLRGGLSREELADKIMQGIVNGALGIEYDQIAPYSHGYEVTFGGSGPIGSTRDFKNRWECYCDFFDVPAKIVSKIEAGSQNGRVFGKNADSLDIHEMLQAIDKMEAQQISAFTPEKETNFERWGARGYGSRGSVASVMDVHAGKGLDGIVQHHYHGNYSTMTPSRQNDLVETLVFMKGFCLDCLGGLDGGLNEQRKVIDYLKKHGTDISTPEKLQAWTRQNPEKCGYQQNRDYYVSLERDRQFFERAYCDFIQLGSLAKSHNGSLETFCEAHDVLARWCDDVMECAYGVLYTQLFENEDGSISVADACMDIWDPARDDFVAEGISISRLREKCQALGMDVTALENKTLAEISGNRVALDDQIREAEAGRGKSKRDSGTRDVDKER